MACAPPAPLQVDEQQGSGDAGAQSGKSETVSGALLLHDPAAAAAEAPAGALTPAEHLQEAQQGSPAPAPAQAEVEAEAGATAGGAQEPQAAAPQLSPLPPPDVSEGPEAAAEYEAYLARWQEGHTLAQRWHRLAQKGLLGNIQADWEDWQLDLMLTEVKQRTAAALSQQGKALHGGSLICSTRLRRGRGEVQEADDSPTEEPRKVRSRRAPSTLQDFHVDPAAAAAAAANKTTPERTPEGYEPAAAAAAGNSGGSRQQQQRLLPDPASEESTDEAADNVTARALQQQQAQQQQQPPARPPGRRGPLPQAPPKRVVTRVQRSGPAPHAAASSGGGRALQRVITPYNPQLLQAQALEAQAAAMAAAMQEQQQVAAAAAMAGVSPEMLEEFYAMGSRLGAAFGQGQGEVGAAAGGLAQNPAAMAAFMHALYAHSSYGGGGAALTQQVASVMGGQQQ